MLEEPKSLMKPNTSALIELWTTLGHAAFMPFAIQDPSILHLFQFSNNRIGVVLKAHYDPGEDLGSIFF